ncbi:anti-sigma factor family protein [Paenibacillus sp. 1001270B_150601_E10]|uniref:anti-sigma factor family protein n=1 Tax=Paenibacillus sp. 1001270B_150601_E10 TaxID=2787079 RepID=UPI00189E1DAB|nr:zf-HC2 domain-containing protein [Paenibacillus sp. 1001270B_150601_E10]
MECAEALEWLPEYAGMPADDPQRLAIEQHLQECEACAEQYRIWAASEAWDESLVDWEEEEDCQEGPTTFRPELVMERIYNESGWLMPVQRRGYRMSPRVRNTLAGIIAFCVSIFICSIVVLAIRADQEIPEMPTTGLVPTAVAGEVNAGSIQIELPGTGASEPFLLHVAPTIPSYWIALSLIGIVFALLLINWLTRVKT